MTETETFEEDSIVDEEESNIEEEDEQIWEDNTTNRDDNLNSTAKTFESIENYQENLEIPDDNLEAVEWDDPNNLMNQTAAKLDATKLIFNTKKYRLEYYAIKGQALHEAYLEQYYDIINEKTDASAAVLGDYDGLW